MAETTIEWTRGPNGEQGYTFNPWIGCTKISPACDNCYAAAQDKFRHWTAEGWGGPRKHTSRANWGGPVKWNADAARLGVRYRVFCASLADVFDNQVPTEWRADLLSLIEKTPRLDWLLLTKRVGNVASMVPKATDLIDYGEGWQSMWGQGAWPANVWLGATIANQEEADRDIQKLLAVPAHIHFLSMEPLLGPVDLTKLQVHKGASAQMLSGPINALGGHASPNGFLGKRLDWVIAGGESGSGARPSHPEWFRSLRDQCAAAGVPFLFKQWGDWVSVSEVAGDGPHHYFEDGATVRRIGKKAAGRLLDGRTWDGFPEGS